VSRFPALYRMPVFYLTLAIVGMTLYASGALTPRREAVFVPSRAEPPIPDVSTSVVSRPESPTPGPPAVRVSDPILRDADWLRRKVVVTGRSVAPRTSPTGDPTGTVLAPFSIRFVYGETPTMLQVGPASTGPEGWIFRSDVSEWDTRLVARPTARSNRPAIEIYGEQSCLVSALSARICPKHGGRCPSEIENGGADGPEPRFGWPILRFATIAGNDGSPRRIDEVVPLVSELVPTETERLAPLRPALRQVYVAFVIDTTFSMKPTIDAARSLATRLAAAVSKQFGDVTLHLGLVEYRDDAPGLGFRARVATPFTDAAGFRAVINSLEAAFREDMTSGESVFDGVSLALPGSPGRLDWPSGRAGELATKLVVLLGDSPDHAVDLDRARALAARARAAGISIASMALDRPDSLTAADHARLESQWNALAEGAYRPLDRARKFASPLPPLSIRVDEAASLATRLQALIEDRVERARSLAELAAAEDDGRLDEYLQSRGLTVAQATPILDDLRRGDPVPKRTRRRVPTLRSGWLAERIGETEFVAVNVLLSRDEIETLIARLSTSTGDPDDLRAIVVAASAGELDFLTEDLRTLTPEDRRKRRAAFPARRTLPVDLNVRVRAAIDGLARWRDSTNWPEPSQAADARTTIPFTLLDF
jgi:hypothetical protein